MALRESSDCKCAASLSCVRIGPCVRNECQVDLSGRLGATTFFAIPNPNESVSNFKMASVEHKTWTYGDGAARTYLCSTDPGLLQLDALNAALGSDMLWWAKALPEDRLQTLVNNCMIIGLYSLEPENSGQPIKGTLVRFISGDDDCD